jgi:hypothetical protein
VATRPGKLAVLAVHYAYPDLLADQLARVARCVAPTLRGAGLRLEYFPIVHQRSAAELVAAAHDACRGVGFAACVDVGERLANLQCKPSLLHGESLAAGFMTLGEAGCLAPDDLLAVLDHDTHPLDVEAFAILARRLADDDLTGIGIPQWHRGHCYLHPSLLLTQAATVLEIGPAAAFKVTLPATPASLDWLDTGEGFTRWCERRGRRRLALRVNACRFPWQRWESDMVPDGGATLTGEHGERVEIGNLMHYGLESGRSLVSHVWGVARAARWYGHGADDEPKILAAYLDEPLAGASG